MYKRLYSVHGHYLLKLIASLAQVGKRHCILLYSCKSFVLYLTCIISAHGCKVLSICHVIMHAEIGLPEPFESLISQSVLNFPQ